MPYRRRSEPLASLQHWGRTWREVERKNSANVEFSRPARQRARELLQLTRPLLDTGLMRVADKVDAASEAARERETAKEKIVEQLLLAAEHAKLANVDRAKMHALLDKCLEHVGSYTPPVDVRERPRGVPPVTPRALNAAQVRLLREEYVNGPRCTIAALAERYKVSSRTVRRALHGGDAYGVAL